MSQIPIYFPRDARVSSGTGHGEQGRTGSASDHGRASSFGDRQDRAAQWSDIWNDCRNKEKERPGNGKEAGEDNVSRAAGGPWARPDGGQSQGLSGIVDTGRAHDNEAGIVSGQDAEPNTGLDSGMGSGQDSGLDSAPGSAKDSGQEHAAVPPGGPTGEDGVRFPDAGTNPADGTGAGEGNGKTVPAADLNGDAAAVNGRGGSGGWDGSDGKYGNASRATDYRSEADAGRGARGVTGVSAGAILQSGDATGGILNSGTETGGKEGRVADGGNTGNTGNTVGANALAGADGRANPGAGLSQADGMERTAHGSRLTEFGAGRTGAPQVQPNGAGAQDAMFRGLGMRAGMKAGMHDASLPDSQSAARSAMAGGPGGSTSGTPAWNPAGRIALPAEDWGNRLSSGPEQETGGRSAGPDSKNIMRALAMKLEAARREGREGPSVNTDTAARVAKDPLTTWEEKFRALFHRKTVQSHGNTSTRHENHVRGLAGAEDVKRAPGPVTAFTPAAATEMRPVENLLPVSDSKEDAFPVRELSGFDWEKLKMEVDSWRDEADERRDAAQQLAQSTRLQLTSADVRRELMPGLVRMLQQGREAGGGRNEAWQSHRIQIADGNNLRISTREVEGVLQMKMGSSNPELSRMLQQHLQEIREHLEKECGMSVDLQLDSGHADGFDRFAGQSGRKDGKPDYRPASGERAKPVAVEKVAPQPVRDFGYNQMEWTI